MRELSIEDYLVVETKKLDGECIKLNPKNARGILDRLCLFPSGVVAFVEVKRSKGGIVSRKQKMWALKLTKLGFQTRVISSKAEVDAFIQDVRNAINDRR